MKTLLFFARNDILNESSSTGRKVYKEYIFFSKHFNTYLLSQSDRKILLTHNNKSKVLVELEKKRDVLKRINGVAIELQKKIKADYMYIRYPKSNPIFLNTLKKINNNGTRIIIEFPTFPYDAEIKSFGKTFRDKIIFYVDRLCRNKLHKYVYSAATFSKDKNIYRIPAFQVYNAIFVDEIKARIPVESNDIHVIAVAEMQRSHGYDRFIYGLSNYYKKKENKKVFLHLVGDGPEKENYEKLVKDLKLMDYVIFHGYCTGDNLEKIYNQCSVAIETLGLHRVGIGLSSSLKSREYLGKGMPILSSADIDILEPDFPYVLKLPSNDTPVDINRVIEFCDNIYKDGTQSVINNIREYAKEHCDFEKNLKGVIDTFYE